MKRIIIASLFAGSFFLVGCGTKPTFTQEQTTKLAQCLTKAGVKMYGTPTCSHCLDQKAMFGESFKEINYIDCSATPNACTQIQGTPTREFSGGTTLLGTQKLEDLAKQAGCTLP
ncbi:MAG: hypothetical protein WCJ39_05895 [bacterium]